MQRLSEGLIAAVHTPFDAAHALDLSQVERLAAHVADAGLNGVFVGGSTGEWSSLAFDERKRLLQRWTQVTRGTALRVLVHVGSNSLNEAQELAQHAERCGVHGIAAVGPFYFKPASAAVLAEWCRALAARAPTTPFYYYDIPSLTGISVPAEEVIERARGLVPTLAGLKLTNTDLARLQRCLEVAQGELDVLYGIDALLLQAWELGVRRAIGGSYAFTAPLFRSLLAAWRNGQRETAAAQQARAARWLATIARYEYRAASKAVMGFLGFDLGPPRLPLVPLSAESASKLRAELEGQGFFEHARSA
jgi:N-acetylneuraminate lyase